MALNNCFIVSLNFGGQEFEQVLAAVSYMWCPQRSLESVQGAGGLDGRIRGSCIPMSGAPGEKAGGRAQLGLVCLHMCLPGRAVLAVAGLLSRKYEACYALVSSTTGGQPHSSGQGS